MLKEAVCDLGQATADVSMWEAAAALLLLLDLAMLALHLRYPFKEASAPFLRLYHCEELLQESTYFGASESC